MANIIDFSTYQKKEHAQPPPSEETQSSEELGLAIQTLIQQLRKAPLQRIG